MELIFKNPTIKTDFEFSKKMEGLSIEETSRLWKRHNLTEQRMAFLAPIGYLRSFCDIADEYVEKQNDDISLDLTYETVKNIPKVLGYQYLVYTASGTYTKEKALELVRKTLASYLMLLCMNEHMCIPTIERLEDFDNIINSTREAQTTPPQSWMGITIKIGVYQEHDLLNEVENAARATAKGSFRMRFSHVIDVYKSMCGVDLREKGLEDLEVVNG